MEGDSRRDRHEGQNRASRVSFKEMSACFPEVSVMLFRYPALDEMRLEWFALPAVSSMMFDVGGIQFPASPFSGWYSLAEVATRDFMDKQRYDLSEVPKNTKLLPRFFLIKFGL